MKRLIPIFLILLITSPLWAYGPDNRLCWNAPTVNADGSPLLDLAGFNILAGRSTGVYDVLTGFDVGGSWR